jgi:hypothetical protein
MSSVSTNGDVEVTDYKEPQLEAKRRINRGQRMSRVNYFLLAIVASLALAGVIYCALRIVAPPEPVPKPFSFDKGAHWITTDAQHQACGCFRLNLDLPANVAKAWVVLASNGGYELMINGDSCAHFVLLSPTQPFQKGLTEMGQKLTPAEPAISVNFPREYQWTHYENDKLPTFVDIGSSLHAGHNAICVEVENNNTTPAFILSGEVVLDTGKRIPIESSAQWRAEPTPKASGQYAWVYSESPVANWRAAHELPWDTRCLRLVPNGVFQDEFQGKRLRSIAPDSITRVEQTVQLPRNPTEGYIRVATDCPFQIWINDHLVQPRSREDGVLTYGPWFLRDTIRSPVDMLLQDLPDWLDPNSVATLLPGQQPENPPHNDPHLNIFPLKQQQVDGSSIHSQSGGDPARNAGIHGDSKVRPRSLYSNLQQPDKVTQPTLTRNRRTMEYFAYDISALLQKGPNRIKIALYKDQPERFPLSRFPFLAFDGAATAPGGGKMRFASGEDSRLVSKSDTGDRTLTPVVNDGIIQPTLLPRLDFFGFVYPDRPWFSLSVLLFGISTMVLLLGMTFFRSLREVLEAVRLPLVVLGTWIWVGVLVRSSMLERSEAIYWRFPGTWAALLGVGVAGAAVALVLQCRQARTKIVGLSRRLCIGVVRVFRRPSSWTVVLALAVILCFAVRAWQIDLQPPDDDEYASLQAALAIGKTGFPEFQSGIWYTRSPVYHYLAGAVAAVSNGNLYALRLLSVLFACATAILLWRMTKEFTGQRLLALLALILYAVHPYLIFASHEARFYQAHQFFHLLGLYFFVRGFVINTGMRDRYLALLGMALAIFSQEITVLQALPLMVCYLLFGQRRSWSEEIRFLIAVSCLAAFILLDFAFFKIECQTALEGVSPRIEAAIGWSFQEPVNFFALLVGYARLHVALSLFMLLGLVAALCRKQRVMTCFYIYLLGSVVVTNLLITSKAFRYEYFLIPLWIFLAMHGLGESARFLARRPNERPVRTVLVLGLMFFMLCSFSPWRIWGSHTISLEANPTQALRYIAQNLRQGDRVLTMEPHPDAALIETGRSDYDLSIPILYDFAYRYDGKLVDRNSGAKVVGNVNELEKAFATDDRLWIACSREQFHARGYNIPWVFPAARVQLFLRNNARLMFRSYQWSVYLWDRKAGHYSTFREKPADWFE